MFAIVRTGGKQYRVEKIAGAAGDKVQLTEVLMKDTETGSPLIAGAQVEAEIIKQGRLRKIFIFKKKRRKHYRRRGGHCQEMTWLKIGKIA